MGATRGEATRSGCVRRACSCAPRSEAVSPKALRQGAVARIGRPVRDCGDAQADSRDPGVKCRRIRRQVLHDFSSSVVRFAVKCCMILQRPGSAERLALRSGLRLPLVHPEAADHAAWRRRPAAPCRLETASWLPSFTAPDSSRTAGFRTVPSAKAATPGGDAPKDDLRGSSCFRHGNPTCENVKEMKCPPLSFLPARSRFNIGSLLPVGMERAYSGSAAIWSAGQRIRGPAHDAVGHRSAALPFRSSGARSGDSEAGKQKGARSGPSGNGNA